MRFSSPRCELNYQIKVYNILNRGAGKTVLAIRSETLWKEGGNMVTYGELFTFVMMLCAVITLVSNFKHKK